MRDSITGEVVRRALTTGQTFGEWMMENMQEPLAPNGKVSAWCGFKGDPKDVAMGEGNWMGG